MTSPNPDVMAEFRKRAEGAWSVLNQHLEGRHARRDVLLLVRGERTREARDPTRDRKRGETMEQDVVAERPHPVFVLANSGERSSERRRHHHA